MKRVKIEVFGRVQGVFFRANTKDKADKLGLKGYVMNKDNGSVEIVAEGSEEKVKELIDWLKKSPGASKVEDVKESHPPTRVKLGRFEIKKEGSFLKDQKKSLGNLLRFSKE